MGRKSIDLTGKRFGKLVAVSFDHRQRTRAYWKCVCDCGGSCVVGIDHLKNGDTVDCGCIDRKKNPPLHITHGMSYTRLYVIWAMMKARCTNPSRREYPRYGGRGIKVCDEWLEFQPFYEWAISSGYSSDLTLDRKNNDGNYSPDNCRWATRFTQANNRSNNRYITHNGQTKTICQWAKEYNLPYYVLQKRIDGLRWDFERAISEPPKKMKKRGS